jgi:hypothetical protein
MPISKARESLIRKFTNYRSRHLKVDGGGNEVAQQEIESRKLMAAALVDWKSLTKGRTQFKRKNYATILQRRDQLMSEDPKLCQLGAFQKAFKELWHAADQDFWEQQASDENDLSIFE